MDPTRRGPFEAKDSQIPALQAQFVLRVVDHLDNFDVVSGHYPSWLQAGISDDWLSGWNHGPIGPENRDYHGGSCRSVKRMCLIRT